MAQSNIFQTRIKSMRQQAEMFIFEVNQSEEIYNKYPHIFHYLAHLPEERIIAAKELYETFPGITMMEAGIIFHHLIIFFPNKIELIPSKNHIPKCKIPAFLGR